MDKEKLKERTEEEKKELPNELPEQTIAAMDRRARNLYFALKANKEMNPALSFKAFEIANDLKSIVSFSGLKFDFSDIEINKDLDKTLSSVGKFITSCSGAINKIQAIKKEASEKLKNLAAAVDKSKNPNEDKINAHINNIMQSMKYQIYK